MKLYSRYIILFTLLIGTLFYSKALSSIKPVSLKRSFSTFPQKIGSFTMVQSETFDQDIIDIAGMDDYIMWNYRDNDGYIIGLYIGYYTDQSEGSMIHSPKHCMPGGGWHTQKKNHITLKSSSDIKYSINQLYMQRGTDKMLAHYWYQSRGRIVANEYVDRLYMIYDSISLQRSDGALVRITGEGDNFKLAQKKQIEFISQLLPILKSYLPD